MDWLPNATIATLKQRAAILKSIRDFFAARDVLEVETPSLSQHTVTDPYIESIPATIRHGNQAQTYYLQTSPEYAMKRLLAAGSGSIYQICKAFRQDQIGHLHNPEFTMLEWYRIGFDHHDLMQELDELLQLILQCSPASMQSYQSIFLKYLNLDPHQTSISELKHCAAIQGIQLAAEINDVTTWLQLLFTHCIEAQLGKDKPCFIYDFPVEQAALAKIQPGKTPTAARFELYVDGIELANGFHELQDAQEQKKRFENNNVERRKLKLAPLPVDTRLLKALEHGLPESAGVAMGLDRLIMIKTKNQEIRDVIGFDILTG